MRTSTTKPARDYWLARDEQRVSWAVLRRAREEQRGHYAAWVTAPDTPKCARPCCAAQAGRTSA